MTAACAPPPTLKAALRPGTQHTTPLRHYDTRSVTLTTALHRPSRPLEPQSSAGARERERERTTRRIRTRKMVKSEDEKEEQQQQQQVP